MTVNWSFVLIFAGLLALQQPARATQNCPLVFEARPMRDSVLPFEKQYVWFSVLNGGDTSLYIQSPSFAHTRVTAVNLDDGRAVSCPTGGFDWAGPDTAYARFLKPGQTYTSLDLLLGPRYSDVSKYPRDPRTGFSPWPQGRILAELRYWHDPWQETQVGPCVVLVDTIRFTVVEESPDDSTTLAALGAARAVNELGARMDSLWSVLIRSHQSRYASLAAFEIAGHLNRIVRPPRSLSTKTLCIELARCAPFEANVGVAIVGLLGRERSRVRREAIDEIMPLLPDQSGVRRLLEINFDSLGRWRGKRQW